MSLVRHPLVPLGTARDRLTLEAAAARAGLHPVLVARFVEFGLVEPAERTGPELCFDAACLPRLRAIVDEAAAAVGRNPAEIERTVAVQVRMEGGTGRIMGDTDPRMTVPPLEGSPEVIAEALRAYAREGIGHVQLVVDPITEASVAALAPVLELLGGY